MATTLYFARHGETVWHAENRYAGSSDVDLTERGRDQARELADWAGGQSIERVVSSDLSRALRTAEYPASALGLPAEVDARFREVDFGEGEGRTAAEMDARFPEARTAFLRAPATNSLPGGEPGMRAIARAADGLYDLYGANAGTVLLVAHTTLLRLTLSWLLGIHPDEYRRVFPALHNAAITTVRLLDGAESAAELPGVAQLLAFNLPTAVPQGRRNSRRHQPPDMEWGFVKGPG